MQRRSIPSFTVFLLALSPSLAVADDDSAVRVGGLIFSHVGADLSEEAEGASEFDIDRVYLNFKARVSDSFSTRVTTDVGRENTQSIETTDATGAAVETEVPEDTKIRVYLKYAYLEWKTPLDGVKTRFGAAGTPLVGYADNFWGHRYVSRAFTDANRIFDSSDIGVHVLGKHSDGLWNWQASLMNGEGYGSPEENPGKTAQGRVSLDPLSGNDGGSLPISGIASTEVLNLEDVESTTILGGALGYKMDNLVVWGEYITQSQGERSGAGYSAVVMPRVPDVANLVLRYDHWDPDTASELDSSNKLIAGLSKDFEKKISAALLWEQETPEDTAAATSQGVFIRSQAGF